MIIEWKGQRLQLLSSKAIYWEEEDALILADLHLGKAAHFRKEGLAAPAQILNTNLEKLSLLLESYKPKRVLFLGDLFHSKLNYAWEYFTELLFSYGDISFELVMGNHDILDVEHYAKSRLIVHSTILEIGPFIFSHFPIDDLPGHLYNFHGHIHPGVRLHGRGKQKLTLPCFYFGPQHGILPAYGAFTGLAIVDPLLGDRVYVITKGAVSEVEIRF